MKSLTDIINSGTITVQGIPYTISQYPQVEHEDALGKTSSDRAELKLARELPNAVKEATFLHELFHAISNELEADLTERQVSVMSVGVYAALKDAQVL